MLGLRHYLLHSVVVHSGDVNSWKLRGDLPGIKQEPGLLIHEPIQARSS